MSAPAETWQSYAQLLVRLSPRISHILFAGADGTTWWSSEPSNASRVQYALSLLLNTPTTNGVESEVLAQMHRHLMTRAQLHGCTLVANHLALDGTDAAVPYKAISTPIRDEARRVIGALAVFRLDTDGDLELRDAEALELLARKAAQILRSSFDPVTGLLTTEAFKAQASARLAASLFMGRLRERGISFALDNFGRGLGSLSHLNSLPVSCIKIDGSFSRDLVHNPKSQSMRPGLSHRQAAGAGRCHSRFAAVRVLYHVDRLIRSRRGENGGAGRLAANRRRTYAAV